MYEFNCDLFVNYSNGRIKVIIMRAVLLFLGRNSVILLYALIEIMSLDSWLGNTGPKPGYKRKADDASESGPPKKKFSKEVNQNSFDWYQKDESGKWHCVVCRLAKFDNAYARGHDTRAKTTNHTRHACSQSHLTAVTKANLAEQQPMKKVIEKKIQSDNDCAYGYLWAAYNLAKRELPKEEFPFMLDLIEMAGKDLKRDSTVHYSSNQSISEFQSAIADVILEDKLSELKKCGVYSIVLDESTDNANRKRLLVYAQYLSKSEIDTCLLNNIEITEGSATADVIVSKILMELRDKGLNLDNLVGVGTDGASVMTGRRNGVVKQLRDKCPSLVGVHCAAHRCALAASQATKNIQEMEWYSRTVSNVFRFFSNSALRENKLREIQELLELPQLKYADIHSVRWLSLENAVSILYRTYPALCATLSHIGASGDVVAKSLYNDVCQYKFIALTHLLMDILPFVGRLSKLFQSESLDFSKVSPMVASTCDSLQDLLECEGVFVDKLFTFTVEESGSVLYRRPSEESVSKTVNEGIKSNIEFDGFETDSDDASAESETVGDVTLRYYQQQKESLPSITRKYVNAITQNLENRFEQKELMQCLEVLVPTNITKQTSIGSYGEKELRIVAENFSTQTAINVDDCMSEYRQYKRLVVGSYSNKSLIEMYAILENKYSEELPNMFLLLKCCAVLPMSSAQCERGFSTQNRIKTKLRTRLNNRCLVDLMRISEDGPALKQFDFSKAVCKWQSVKLRKLYSK